MNLDELNEREIQQIQLFKHDSNQGQAQSHENGGFSSNGMNSMTIDRVLKTPTDRVEDLMNLDSSNYNLQQEFTSQIRRQRQLKRTQNRMDKGTINTIQNNGIDLRTLQIMFQNGLDKLAMPSMCYICQESYLSMKVAWVLEGSICHRCQQEKNEHRFSASNNMDPGPQPLELSNLT